MSARAVGPGPEHLQILLPSPGRSSNLKCEHFMHEVANHAHGGAKTGVRSIR
jgi:hypothetical protein